MDEGFKQNTNQEVKEVISSAAVLYNGEIFRSYWHEEAREKCREKFPGISESLMQDGWVTNLGRFVTRDEQNKWESEVD